MSWRELLTLLDQLPSGSALHRAEDPDGAEWSATEQLLAAIFDALNVANYQRTDGKGPKPQPLPRPGVGERNVRRHGKTHLSREEVLRIVRPNGMNTPTEGGDDGD